MTVLKIEGVEDGEQFAADGLLGTDPVNIAEWNTVPAAVAGTSRSIMFNPYEMKEYTIDVCYLNVMKAAKWTSQPSQTKFEPDGAAYQTGRIPAEILAGDTALRANHAWTKDAHTFHFGSYVLRYTPHAGYVVSIGGVAQETANSAGRIEFDVNELGNWRVEITGPEGPAPDFNTSVVRADREALLDGTDGQGLPADDARRIFNPDWLAQWSRDNPDHIRTVKFTGAEHVDWREIADIPRITDQCWLDGMPIEVICILGNYLQCGMWFNQFHRSSDALIDFMAEYVRDNLDPGLQVYIEEFNESWNGAYIHAAHYGAVGMRRYATPGTGTLSFVKGTNEITGDFDLRTVFGHTEDKSNIIAVGDYEYVLDANVAVEADIMYLPSYRKGFEDLTNEPYWHGRDYYRRDGFAIESAHTIQRWITAFENAPGGSQRSRLTTIMPGQLQNIGVTNRFLTPANWSNDGDYVPATTIYDALALNLYFGSGLFNDEDIVAEIEDLQQNSPGTAVNETYKQLMFGTHPTLTSTRDLPWMELRLQQQHAAVAGTGIKVIAYEGGCHIIHSGPVQSDWNLVLESFDAFLLSPQAEDVFREWAILNTQYLEGPMVVFSHFGSWTHFGYYATYPEYNYAGDSRTRMQDECADKPNWWGQSNAPQLARPIPDQVFSGSTTPGLDLSAYCTRNATDFASVSPLLPGTLSLNTDGTFSGNAGGAVAATDYTFRVSNAGGTNGTGGGGANTNDFVVNLRFL